MRAKAVAIHFRLGIDLQSVAKGTTTTIVDFHDIEILDWRPVDDSVLLNVSAQVCVNGKFAQVWDGRDAVKMDIDHSHISLGLRSLGSPNARARRRTATDRPPDQSYRLEARRALTAFPRTPQSSPPEARVATPALSEPSLWSLLPLVVTRRPLSLRRRASSPQSELGQRAPFSRVLHVRIRLFATLIFGGLNGDALSGVEVVCRRRPPVASTELAGTGRGSSWPTSDRTRGRTRRRRDAVVEQCPASAAAVVVMRQADTKAARRGRRTICWVRFPASSRRAQRHRHQSMPPAPCSPRTSSSSLMIGINRSVA